MPYKRPKEGLEFRASRAPIELRESETDARLRGMAVPYGGSSVPIWGLFTEEIARGAFSESLSQRSVHILIGHDDAKPVASTKSGNLVIEDRESGLFVDFAPVKTQMGKDLLENVRSGLIEHMSVGMVVREDEWERKDGKEHRIVTKADLYEVSAVVWPAYEQTELSHATRSAYESFRNGRDLQTKLSLQIRALEAMLSLPEKNKF